MIESDKEQSLAEFPVLSSITDKLELYEELIVRWQAKVNLIGKGSLNHLWRRHFADSAQLSFYGAMNKVWIDLGTGAGFPGIIIAMLQEQMRAGSTHLIEADQRKAAFLREVSRETGIETHIHCTRAEEILYEIDGDYITSRAMAHLKPLVSLTHDAVDKGAICLFLKGKHYQNELTSAGIDSKFSTEIFPSKTESGGVIIRIGRMPSNF